MAEMSASRLEHRQARSDAVQPMVVAAESRQLKAHWGSWLTRPSRSLLEVEVDVEPVVVGVWVDWAATEAIKIAAVVR